MPQRGLLTLPSDAYTALVNPIGFLRLLRPPPRLEQLLPSARRIVERARWVQIDAGHLRATTRRLAEEGVSAPPWAQPYHFSDGGPRTVAYVMLLDSLNFCFWGEPRWVVEYRGQRYSGYPALAASLTRAFEDEMPLWEAGYLEGLREEEVRALFRGEGELPLFRQRLAILRGVGRALRGRWAGQFTALIEEADGSAVGLVRLLAAHLPGFADAPRVGTQRVPFYKRAQICAADLWGAFGGQEWGAFMDLDRLTAFADYKLPQILRHWRILTYAPALARRVDALEPLKAGSREEVELRAATIWAVEQLRRELGHFGLSMRAFELDWALWSAAQGLEMAPHHRTLTIRY